MKKLSILFCCILLLSGCISKSSTDAVSAFEYWTKGTVPKGFVLLNGEYYQSPHFTLEYEVFLKFKPTKQWWHRFKEQNQLVETTPSDDDMWIDMTRALDWFKPDDRFIEYKLPDEWNRSRYFIDYEKGVCYVYETLGM